MEGTLCPRFVITLPRSSHHPPTHPPTPIQPHNTGGGLGGAGGGGGGAGGPPGGINPVAPIGALLGLAGIAYGGYNSFYTVEGGHRALLFNRLVGVKEEVHMEGMHFMIPWFEMPIIYDIRPKPRMIQSLTGSKGRWVVLVGGWVDCDGWVGLVWPWGGERERMMVHLSCLCLLCTYPARTTHPPTHPPNKQTCKWSTSRSECFPSRTPASSGGSSERWGRTTTNASSRPSSTK